MSPPNALAAWRANNSLTTTGSTASTGILSIATGAHKGGGIQVLGTFSATLQFEQSLDGGTTWIAKTVFPAAGGPGVTSTTATGQWKFACGGETNVRVRCSAFTSGPADVSIVLTKGSPDVTQGSAGGASLNVVEKGITATFTTLTRPANTTAYAANDSISDNGTAGSVTALTATVSDTNDAPFVLTDITVTTTDTGLGAGISIRAYIYNSDPTANSGVGGGDNAAFSNKQAGRIATFTGTFIAASDGGVAHLAPENTGPPVLFPSTGGKALWIQYQTLGAFTPSANSTTLIAKAKGYQLRA